MTASHLSTRIVAATSALVLVFAASSESFARPATPVQKCRTVKEIQCESSPTGQLSNCRDVIKTICVTVDGPGSGRID